MFESVKDSVLTDLILSREDEVTPKVLNAMADTEDARLHEIMTSLVRHAHAFFREVRPTEEEYEAGLRYLNDIGQASNEAHNEAVLFCDVLGLSTLVDLINNNGMQGETMSALLGPFYRGAAPACDNGECMARTDTGGDTLLMKGRVLDVDGRPIAGAKLDVWQADPKGLYENQDPDQADFNLRALYTTDADGCYRIHTIRPAGYPVPTHTSPTGPLLAAQKRDPHRPAHIHFIVSAPARKTLITQIFVDERQAMADDVVFGAKEQISVDLQRSETPDPDFPGVAAPFMAREYDFILKPGEPCFPTPPISGKVRVEEDA